MKSFVFRYYKASSYFRGKQKKVQHANREGTRVGLELYFVYTKSAGNTKNNEIVKHAIHPHFNEFTIKLRCYIFSTVYDGLYRIKRKEGVLSWCDG